MTTTGLAVFDETVHATNTWLHEITSRMGWDDRQKSYRLLRLSLHALRDRMPVNATAKLSAQLPMLIRGFFYEGWEPNSTPNRIRTRDEFLAPLREAFSAEPAFEAEAAFREVIGVMRLHVSPGEVDAIRRVLPADLAGLLEAESARG